MVARLATDELPFAAMAGHPRGLSREGQRLEIPESVVQWIAASSTPMNGMLPTLGLTSKAGGTGDRAWSSPRTSSLGIPILQGRGFNNRGGHHTRARRDRQQRHGAAALAQSEPSGPDGVHPPSPINPFDSLAYAGGLILVSLAALGAAWLPARRTARIDPTTALRFD